MAAYLLLVLGGKASPTVADIEKLLSSVGVNVDQSKANFVVNQMKGKTVDAVMAEGARKLGAMPAAAGSDPPKVAVTSGSSGGGGGGENTESKPADTEEANAGSDNSDDDMGFGLFGDDDD